jgi:PilZ domain
MENSGRKVEMTTELRRHPRLRVPAPFACSFARIGLQRWLAAERAGLGVVLDVSMKGARVMSPASMSAGDQLAISLRLPDQTATMNVEATVRWGNRHTFGLEFTVVSQLAESRLRKFLSRAPLSHS